MPQKLLINKGQKTFNFCLLIYFLGLGGVILIENGKVKVHVMPDFSKTPLKNETDLNNWLNFFEVSTPLVGLGFLVSRDPVIIFICVKYNIMLIIYQSV